MKTLKISVLLLISIFFLAKDASEIKGCVGEVYDPDDMSYNFYDQTINGQFLFYPFLFSFHTYFNQYADTTGDYNTGEWLMEYFNNKVPEADISSLVYHEKISSLILVRKMLKGRKINVDTIVGENRCYKWIIARSDTDLIDYLIYAKQKQPLEPYWDWQSMKMIKPEGPDYNKASKEGFYLYKKTKSPFLKLKYGFQLTRMAQYSGNYDDCVKRYNELVFPYKKWTYTKFRALCHKAGALQAKEENVVSSYLFSYVFDRSPAYKMTALAGFNINTDEEFKECLSLCQDNREKTTLYLMRGIAPYANGLEELEEIYKIDPFSDQIDILLSREIKMLEIDFLNLNPPDAYNYDLTWLGKYDVSYLRQIRSFMAKIIKNWQAARKTEAPVFWQISDGYLALYDKDFISSEKTISVLRTRKDLKKWESDALNSMQIAMDVTLLDNPDRKKIEHIFKEYKNAGIVTEYGENARSDSRFRYFLDKLANLYGNSGDTAMSYLCGYEFNDLYYYGPNSKIVDGILAWRARKDLNSFEIFLLRRGGNENQVNEMKGTILLAEGNPDEAVTYFKKVAGQSIIPRSFYIEAKPFDFYYSDNVDDDDSLYSSEENYSKAAISKLKYAEQLILLKKEAMKKGEKAAVANYKLGNACYNTTWYGHAWMALAYSRSVVGPGPYIELSDALKYYKRALQLTKDKELAAKCAFMAAKCELYPVLNWDWNYKILHENNKNVCGWYDKLKNDYSKTEFYKEMISECGYLRDYVSGY